MSNFFQKFEKLVEKHSIRKTGLIIAILLVYFGVTFTGFGTYSSDYTIETVHFSTATFYQKAILYGPIYKPLNVSLVPDNPEIYTVSAYVFTPTKRSPNQQFPTVIWSHGMVATCEMQFHYCMEMARAGFKVIAIHLDGHGDSGGLWSIGLTNLQTIYAAVEYAAGLPDVNTSQIVVSGHSNGGYAVARAALFDKSPLGTGGLIKACASLWTCSDVNETLHELANYGEPIDDPSYTWLIPMFMGVPKRAITNEDILRRSINHYVTESNLPNWFIISGEKDQMSSPEVMYSAMGAAVGSQANKTFLKQTIEAQLQTADFGQWNNTNNPNVSITNGTARKIEIAKGVDHVGEAFSPVILQKIIDWFIFTLNLDPAQYQSPMAKGENVIWRWVMRMGGWVLLVVAMVLAMILLIVFLAPVFFPERLQNHSIKLIADEMQLQNKPERQYGGFLPPGLDEYLVTVDEYTPRSLFMRFANTWKQKGLYFIGLAGCLAAAVAIFFVFQPMPYTRIFIFNAYLWQFFIAGILVWIYALWVLVRYYRSRYYGPYVSLARVGGTWSGLVRGFLYASMVVFAPVTIFNILALILKMPRFFPRPAETGIWGDVILGTLMMWILFLPFEVMVKTQLYAIRSKYATKTGYWLEILMNGILVFLIWMVGYIIGSLFLGKNLLMLIYVTRGFGGVLFLAINSIMFLVNGALTFVTGLMYQRSRNIFACSFFMVFFWSLILFGKFFGIYSIF